MTFLSFLLPRTWSSPRAPKGPDGLASCPRERTRIILEHRVPFHLVNTGTPYGGPGPDKDALKSLLVLQTTLGFPSTRRLRSPEFFTSFLLPLFASSSVLQAWSPEGSPGSAQLQAHGIIACPLQRLFKGAQRIS